MASIWAKILDGLVINLQMCSPDDEFSLDFVWVDLGTNVLGVDIGWSYDGAEFTAANLNLDGV